MRHLQGKIDRLATAAAKVFASRRWSVVSVTHFSPSLSHFSPKPGNPLLRKATSSFIVTFLWCICLCLLPYFTVGTVVVIVHCAH